jgi:hypothetical protein
MIRNGDLARMCARALAGCALGALLAACAARGERLAQYFPPDTPRLDAACVRQAVGAASGVSNVRVESDTEDGLALLYDGAGAENISLRLTRRMLVQRAPADADKGAANALMSRVHVDVANRCRVELPGAPSS